MKFRMVSGIVKALNNELPLIGSAAPPSTERRSRASLALSVVLPCFNEAEHIEEILRGWIDYLKDGVDGFEIIVVNDGSIDGTGRTLDRLRKEQPALRVVHQLNGGREAAVRRGYEMARGAYVLQTESNGRFDPTDFTPFWEKRAEYDLLLARRTRPLEGCLTRIHLKALRSLVKLLFGVAWQEPNAPFRLLSRRCLERLFRLPPDVTQVNVWLGILAHTDRPGSVAELPVPFRFRNGLRRPASLWHLAGLILNTTVELLQLRLRLLRYRIPETTEPQPA